jgi:hypothetical protein
MKMTCGLSFVDIAFMSADDFILLFKDAVTYTDDSLTSEWEMSSAFPPSFRS